MMFSYYIKYGIRYSLRYILKYIIRVIIFFGIIYLISFLSGKHLFIANVDALSCNVSNRTTSHPLESWHGNILNSSRESHMDISYYDRDTFQNNDSRIYFDNNDSYIDVLVPFTWTMAFQNNPVYNDKIDKDYQFHIQSSPPILYLVDNTGPNRWYWTMGVWDNGYYRVRYFKSDFPDNYVSLAQVKIGLPTWWYNFVVSTFVSLNGYFQVDHFHCDSNKALKEAIDENTKAQEKTNNTIKDDNVDSSTNQGSSFFNDFNSGDEGTLSDIVSLPLEYVQHLNDTCKPFTISAGKLGDFSIPCLSSIWSSTSFAGVINTASIIINGIICYKLLTSLFLFFKDLKDPDDDKVEVMNL